LKIVFDSQSNVSEIERNNSTNELPPEV